ncbi:Molecular chaperone of HSP90 family protein, partial CDS, partial [Neorhizobium galegae bv. orientalis]
LDRRRAPPFVRALDRPSGVSSFHWSFQGRLSFPRITGDAIQFTAGEACPISESESWWLGFDAFSLADRELRETDLLLRDRRRDGLRVRRVHGVQDPRELAQDVPVIGWKPVNSPFHVSDVPRIISILGGAKLYGNDWRVPLRELLQNAVDAIKARRHLQSNASLGEVRVSLDKRCDDFWLVVEDDGVGMSEQVLTQNLVDFGSSLWRSTDVAEEFPGLAGLGMNSIGRFGIGFFSFS